MGARLALTLYAEWSQHLTPGDMNAAVRMALTARDDGAPPLYYGGWEALAAALGQDGREGPADQPAHSVPATAAPAPATAGGVSASSGEAAVDMAAAELVERVRPSAPVVAIMGPLRVIGAAGDAPVARSTGTASEAQTQRCAALAAFLAFQRIAFAAPLSAALVPPVLVVRGDRRTWAMVGHFAARLALREAGRIPVLVLPAMTDAEVARTAWSEIAALTGSQLATRPRTPLAPPSNAMRPWLGASSPVRRRRSVLLPQPLLPITATNSPA